MFETCEIHKSGILPPSCDWDKHLLISHEFSHGRKLEHDICCWIGGEAELEKVMKLSGSMQSMTKVPAFSFQISLEVSEVSFFPHFLPGVFFFFGGGEVLFGGKFLRLAVEKGDASSDFGSLVFVGFQQLLKICEDQSDFGGPLLGEVTCHGGTGQHLWMAWVVHLFESRHDDFVWTLTFSMVF